MTDESGPGAGGEGSAGGGEQPPQVGPLAEEAARLFDAISGWAREQGGQVGSAVGDGASALVDEATRMAHEIDDHVATDDAECQWCPICRTVHAVRHLSPEVRNHLASAATSLAHAAAGMLATDVPSDGTDTRSETVERIRLDDDPGDEG